MKDIDLRTIQPVSERRTPEKPASSEAPASEAFRKELDSAVTRAEAPGSIADRVRIEKDAVNLTGEQIDKARNSLQRMLVEMQIRNNRSDK